MRITIQLWLLIASFGISSAFGQSLDEAIEAYRHGDYSTAIEIYKPLAGQGDSNAQYNLGVIYANGNGISQDFTEAVKWYRRAAEQGYAEAQYNLGNMYHRGDGVPQNYSEAAKLYRLAAKQGFVDAQINLAIAYHKGEGLHKNHVMGYMLNTLAMNQGSETARNNRNISQKLLSQGQIVEAQQMASEWRVGTPLPVHDDFTTWP